MNRREARESAFKLLFQYKFQPDDTKELLERFLAENNPGGQEEYIRSTVEGTVLNIEKIDSIIAGCSGRDFARVSAVCLAVLRLGTYEIYFSDGIPAPVAVSEAVAIAKNYDGDEATSFVNGVLDRMVKEKSSGKAKEQEEE